MHADTPSTATSFKSIFDVPKMDCPSEERLIRMALSDVQGIESLAFDIQHKRLTVEHREDGAVIQAKLDALKLDARLVSTVTTSAAPAQMKTSGDIERRTLIALLAINAVMFLVEQAAGWIADSAGLIADSLDMLADAVVYGVSLYAVGRSTLDQRWAAHLSGWLQLLLALAALMEVARRFIFGADPEPPFMMAVAFLALIANVYCLILIARHRHGRIHMKASWIFSTNDVIANVGVILAGLLVALTGSHLPDVIVGAVIAAVVLYGAMRILRL